MKLVRDDIGPRRSSRARRSRTRSASIAASGGSTNGVLHLLAIARELGIPLTLEDFDAIAARTPIVADIKPGGRFVATDLHAAGGVALVARELLKRATSSRGSAPNVDGRSLGADRRRRSRRRPGQEVVVPLETPLKATGGLAILRGNLAPDGCDREARRATSGSSTAGRRASSTRRRPASQPSRHATIQPGDVVVIRYEGPAGGPGMREMLHVTARDRRRRASATRSRSSPTGASRARRTGSWSATSRPRRSTAGRSPRSRRATRSCSTSRRASCDVELSDDELDAPGSRPGRRRSPATRPASSPSTRRSSPRPRRAPSPVPSRQARRRRTRAPRCARSRRARATRSCSSGDTSTCRSAFACHRSASSGRSGRRGTSG